MKHFKTMGIHFDKNINCNSREWLEMRSVAYMRAVFLKMFWGPWQRAVGGLEPLRIFSVTDMAGGDDKTRTA